MNQVLVKVKDRNNPLQRLMEKRKLFNKPINTEECVEYCPSRLLEDGEWFYIRNFSKEPFGRIIFELNKDTVDYIASKIIDLDQMEFLISCQNENEYYFQRIFKKNKIYNKRFIHIENECEIKEQKNAIEINILPDALYVKEEDKLYFRKLETITPIFDGIDKLYREATEQEVCQFLELEFIKTKDGYETSDVKKANRKRIALALTILEKMNNEQKNMIFKYIDDYYPNLKYDGSAFEISKEEDLKHLIYGIEQKYYTTPVTREKRCANSTYNID